MVLEVGVGADGVVHRVLVVKSLDYGLDEEAAREWRFTPGESSGKTAPVQILLESSFRCPEAISHDWQEIAVALKTSEKGEQKAHTLLSP